MPVFHCALINTSCINAMSNKVICSQYFIEEILMSKSIGADNGSQFHNLLTCIKHLILVVADVCIFLSIINRCS